MAEKLARTTFETGIQDKLATVDVYTQSTAKDPIDALLDTVGIDIDDIGKLLGGLTGVPALLADFFGDLELGDVAAGFLNGLNSELNTALTSLTGNSAFVNSLSTLMKGVATGAAVGLTDFNAALAGIKTTVFPADFEDKAALSSIGKYMIASGVKLGVPGAYAAVQASLKNHPAILLEVTKSFLVSTALTPNIASLQEISTSSLAGQVKTLNPKFFSDFLGNFKLPPGSTPAQYKAMGASITAAFFKIDPNWNKKLKSDGTYVNDSSVLAAASDDFRLLMETASVSAGVGIPLASRTLTTETFSRPLGTAALDFSYPTDAVISQFTSSNSFDRRRRITLSDGTTIDEIHNTSNNTVVRNYIWTASTQTTINVLANNPFATGPFDINEPPRGTAPGIPLASRTITTEIFNLPPGIAYLQFVYPEDAKVSRYTYRDSIRIQEVELADRSKITIFTSYAQNPNTVHGQNGIITRNYEWTGGTQVSVSLGESGIPLPNRITLTELFKITASDSTLPFVYPADAVVGSFRIVDALRMQTVTLSDGTVISITYNYVLGTAQRLFNWQQNTTSTTNFVAGGGGTAIVNTTPLAPIPLPSTHVTVENFTVPLGVAELDFRYPAGTVIGNFERITDLVVQNVTLPNSTTILVTYNFTLLTARRVFTYPPEISGVSAGVTVWPVVVGGTGALPYVAPTYRWQLTLTTKQIEVQIYRNPDGGISGYNVGPNMRLFSPPPLTADMPLSDQSGEYVEYPIGGLGLTANSFTANIVAFQRVIEGQATGGSYVQAIPAQTFNSATSAQSNLVPSTPAAALPAVVRTTTSAFALTENYTAPGGDAFTVIRENSGASTLVTETPSGDTMVTTTLPAPLATSFPPGDPLSATSLILIQNPLVMGSVINQAIEMGRSESGNANNNVLAMNASQALAHTFVDLP